MNLLKQMSINVVIEETSSELPEANTVVTPTANHKSTGHVDEDAQVEIGTMGLSILVYRHPIIKRNR